MIDGINGACVEIDDVDALARETERLLKLPDEQWRRMSANAFETTSDLSWDRSAALFEQALERVVSRASADSGAQLFTLNGR